MSENITKILHSTRQDSWGQKLKNIKKTIEEYDKARTGQSRSSSNEIVKSLNNILPTYWDVFHTHNTARRRNGELLKRDDSDEACLPSYDIGIFLVGYSSLPIALSLAEIQPTGQIYFLYSSDTRPILLEIGDRLQKMLDDSYQLFVDRVVTTAQNNQGDSALAIDKPSDPVATFKRIKEIIDNIDDVDNKRIALDLTGGKKTMLGGGYTAGAIWASKWSEAAQGLVPFCDMYYIDSLEYKPERGSPEPGTEFLSQLVNPYDVYDVQSLGKAEALFYEHNYEAAVHLWREVQEKLGEHADRYGLQNEQDAVEKDLHMADCYSLWDAFDYKTAFDESAQPNGHLWEYTRKHVSAEINVLDILRDIEDQKTLFADEARVIHWAVDRYQNAVRRYESDRFNDAIVRFTQVVEILCIYQIYQVQEAGELTDRSHNVITCPEVVLDEHWSVTKLIHFLFTERPNEMYEGRYRIGNLDKRLKIDEYDYRDVRHITRLIKHRNMFVHVEGTPAWEDLTDNAEKLRELALKFLENFSKDYCCCKGLDFDDLLELHRFCR